MVQATITTMKRTSLKRGEISGVSKVSASPAGCEGIGRVSIDHTLIDCRLVLQQFPHGCMLEVAHGSLETLCYVNKAPASVLLAFSEDCETHRTIFLGPRRSEEEPFIPLGEKLFLLLPESLYFQLSTELAELNAGL